MLSHIRFMFALDTLKKYVSLERKTGFFLNPQLIYQNFLVYYFTEDRPPVEDSLRKILRIPDDISKAMIQQYYTETLLNGNQEFCHTISGLGFSSYTTDHSFWFTNSNFLGSYHQGNSYDSVMRRKTSEKLMKIFSMCGHVKACNGLHIDQMRELINGYANLETRRIDKKNWLNLFPPKSIDTETSLVMVNAVHIKDKLAHFKNNHGSKVADVIPISTANHGKSDQLHAYIMEAPYKEIKKLSIFFLFPLCHLEYGKENFFDTTENGIIQLIERLATEEGSRELRKLLNDGMPRQPDGMKIPMFKIKQNLRMNELLWVMGMQDLITFNTDNIRHRRFPTFTNKNDNTEEIYSDTRHQVRIDIMGEDAIADANNAIYPRTLIPYDELELEISVNGRLPCVCLIYDKIFCNILFSGVLMKNNEQNEVY